MATERVISRSHVARSQRAIQLGTNPDHSWLVVDVVAALGGSDEAVALAKRLDSGESRLEVIVVEVPVGG
ncbi:MAG TPA: hypothetical protein VJN18_32610 [Polyangiaceae bacterium]|nr:hypothetical protein [Polyangiaceae bacterium]